MIHATELFVSGNTTATQIGYRYSGSESLLPHKAIPVAVEALLAGSTNSRDSYRNWINITDITHLIR